jgi:MinD superfamily P-loop ATPase
MKLAMLSGKGGAGKTLVAVNLAALDEKGLYVDCDVEEPNGHLFLKPTDVKDKDIYIKIPEIDSTTCNGCRKCIDFCKFNALAYITNKVLVFEEVCHSCGGCEIICPENAITEKNKSIGMIREGMSENLQVASGFLNIGEVSGVPIINALNEQVRLAKSNVYIDCPPGSACVVMESIKEADYCIIVAEPTIFGVHNMAMVVELTKKFGKPLGVVVNKSLNYDNPVRAFCSQEGIKIIGEIPYEQELGSLNSKGEIAVKVSDKYRTMFSEIRDTVLKEVANETTLNS